MALWSFALESPRGQQDPLRTQQIGGCTGILERAPAHLTIRCQLLASNEAARCSSFARSPALAKECLAGGGSSGEGGGQEQELFLRQFFLEHTLWWDNRQDKKGSRSPDFRRKGSHEVFWLINFYKPTWVDALDMQMSRCAPTSKSSLLENPDPGGPAGYKMSVTAETVSTICQQGKLTEAVEALEVLVQTDSPISKSLFYAVLKQCIAKKNLVLGRCVHALIVKRGYKSDTFLCNHILRMYAYHARLQEAMDVFTVVAKPDAFMWSSIISAHVTHRQAKRAIELYQQMRSSAVKPDGHVFVAALQACASGADLKAGQQVHADVLASAIEPDLFVCSCLVDMYAKCGSLEDAQTVFNGISRKNVVTWNAMIAGYAKQGRGQEALSLYNKMQQEGMTSPDSVTFMCLLQACACVGITAMAKGKELHAQIEERRLQRDAGVCCSLINMYAKCGCLEDAHRVFDGLYQKDVVTWTAMIAGYAQQGMGEEALGLYNRMQHEGISAPDSVTFACLLQACASVGITAMERGKQLHAEIKERGLQADVVVVNSLINMYAKCGSVQDAQRVFDGLHKKDVVTWTAMIAGYVQQGMGQEALRFYDRMEHEGISAPDSVTFSCLLQACASVGVPAMEKGKQLHAQIEGRGLQHDVVVGCRLVNMYAKCGCLEEAQRVFDGLVQKDAVTWTAMIAGYVQQGMGQEALNLHKKMQQEGVSAPDSVTFVCLLQACASVGITAMEEGKQLHAEIEKQGLESDGIVVNSLITMFAKCGSIEDSRRVFDRLHKKDVMTWNAMIAAYVQQGMHQEALSLYDRMQHEGISAPDSVTYVCLLQACASAAALHPGRQLHAQIEKQGLAGDVFVGTNLVNMYAKSGSMVDAQKVFEALPERDIVAWNALIAGYTRQGDSEVVFDLVHRMREHGIQPNDITFLSVLTVCSHAGLVNKGRESLEAMSRHYGITPTVEHYACMVDLLGRAGQLDEALEVVQTMPVQPHDSVWHALLGACRKWSNVEVGRHAFEEAVKLDEKDAVAYVMLFNIYTGAQMWEEAQEIQERRKKIGAWKQPGQSWWTDMSGRVHTFLVGDKQHLESEAIYARLKQLVPKMKKEGYIPHLESALRGISDDEKEAHLCEHSERLAISYALNKTPDGTTIRIVKNLRVCVDCHTATAYISKIEKRTIICRDASRFHVYKDGKCSCGDYW